MAKRFTDTDKWKKPFIRGLQGAYKLLWLYIIDDCDHAGIWQVDIDVAQVRIGEALDLEEAIQQFSGKIIPFSNGEKWFIPSFIDFQYGELNPQNRAHNSVLSLLKKYNLLNNKNKPLTSPLQGAMDMDKEKDMDKEQEEGGTGETIDPRMKEISEALMMEFGFSELHHYDKLRDIWQFIKLLEKTNRIDYFIRQFKSYKRWKEISGEKNHGFQGFIINGGWDADNWQFKIDNFKPKGTKPDKMTETVKAFAAAENPFKK